MEMYLVNKDFSRENLRDEMTCRCLNYNLYLATAYMCVLNIFSVVALQNN